MAENKIMTIPPPPPGFTEDVVRETPNAEDVFFVANKQAGRVIGSALSRVGGVLFGGMNAPLAFIKGAMNAPYINPQEYDAMPWYQKPFVNMAGGLESAYRSAAKTGDWGEQYETYYKGKTGRELKQDYGEGADYLKLGLDLMMDPMVGPMMGVDLAKAGVTTVGQFVKYVKSGAVEAGVQSVTKLPKGTAEDVVKLNVLDDTEKTAIRESFVQRLNDIKMKAQAEVRPDTFSTVYGQDSAWGTPSVGSLIEKRFNPPPKDPDAIIKLLPKGERGFTNYDFTLVGKPYAEEANSILESAQRMKGVLRDKNIIETERAASGAANFQGTKLPLKLEESDPELAAKLDSFFGRSKEGYEPTPIIGGEDATKFRSVLGAAFGIEQDEKGDWTYNPAKGALGTVAAAGAFTLFRKPGVARGIDTAGFSPEGKKVADMYQSTLEVRQAREKITWNKIKNAMTRAWIDTSGNLKEKVVKIDPTFGAEVQKKKELIAGSGARASNMMQTYNELIFDGLNKLDSELLNTGVQSSRTIAIDGYKGIGTIAHPEGLGGVEHLSYLNDLKNLDPVKYSDTMARVDLFHDAMLDQLTMMRDEGIISHDSFNNLSKTVYSPRQFMQHLDDIHTNIRGQRITVAEKQIKALDEGSLNLLMNDAQLLLSQQVYKTQDIIFRNRANLALLDFAQANPGNGVVQESKIASYTKAGKPVYQDAPGGFEKISVQVNGEHKEMLMPNEMAQEWVKNDPLINQTLATWLQWGTGTAPVKALATGYNPVFSLGNIPRDLALIWNATTEYSAHLPVGMGQLAIDLAEVAKDVATRKGRVQAFINEGGSMDFMTYQGRFSGTGDVGQKLSSLGEYLGWVGETSELWTRMALRERAIKNGASAENATWAARKYLDFSQGGNIAKALDSGMPFLNASIQGTRSLFQAAKKNPGIFAYKMAQLATVASGLYIANQLTNPECLEQISDRVKESNFIITTPWSYKDSNGQERNYYFTIAKDQGQRSLTSLVEGIMQYYMTGKTPTKQMMMAVGDMVNMPIPPVFSALSAAFMNKDTWTMEDVWRGPKVETGQEYTPDTNPMAVAVGNIGLSPQRTAGALNKIVPANNLFTGLVGWGTKQIFEGMDPDRAKKTSEEIILSAPGVNKILSQTSPYNQWHDELEKTRMIETTRRYQQSREVDKLATAYFKDQNAEARDKLISLIEKQPEEDQKRLTDRVVKYSQTAQLPDRYWWVTVGSMPYDARARAFIDRFDKENASGQMRMLDLSEKISGFNSDEFVSSIQRLKGNKGR